MLDLEKFLDPNFIPKPASHRKSGLKKKNRRIKLTPEQKENAARLRMIRKIALNKPRPQSQVLFWNLYTCICGSVSEGANFENNPFLKAKTPKGLLYTPIPTRLHDYPAEVEYKEVKIHACPCCFTDNYEKPSLESNQLKLEFFNPMEISIETTDFEDFCQLTVNNILKALTRLKLKKQEKLINLKESSLSCLI